MIIQRHNTNDIVVILVFAAAFALLFLDVVIIFARGEKKEGFAVSSTSISRDDFRFDITDDLRWQRPVQLAYLRVLRRYPTLAEQAAYVKVLISFDRQTGGDEDDTKDPVQRVSNLLEETDEYKSLTQGYAPDAALDSTQTRRFAPLFSQYHSPERFFIYMAIIDAFKLRTQRLPNADEIFDIYEKENEADDEYFYLIRTIGQNEIQDAPPENLNLFGQSEEKRAVLIPALKKVDYLLKFKTPKVSADENLRKLKIIPPVALAYMVEDPAIISHKNLIFY
jgi:hypothetical protein